MSESKWKHRRNSKTQALKEIMYRVLQRFPTGVQYYDLVKLVNAETRHNFSRNGIVQSTPPFCALAP